MKTIHSYIKKDTLIDTEIGYVEIQNLNKGDFVMSSNGHALKVKKVLKKKFKNALKIKSLGFDELVVSDDTSILIRDKLFNSVAIEDNWLNIKELSNSCPFGICLSTPIINNSEIPKYNEFDCSKKDIWNLVGRYITYVTSSAAGLELKGSYKQLNSIIENLHIPMFINHSQASIIIPHDSSIGKILTKYNSPALVSQLKCLPKEYAQEVLEGIVDTLNALGKNQTIQINSDDKNFIYEISRIVHKAYNISCESHRVLDENGEYYYILYNTSKNFSKSVYKDGRVWYPISSVQEIEVDDEMYSIEFDSNEPIVANNAIIRL